MIDNITADLKELDKLDKALYASHRDAIRSHVDMGTYLVCKSEYQQVRVGVLQQANRAARGAADDI